VPAKLTLMTTSIVAIVVLRANIFSGGVVERVFGGKVGPERERQFGVSREPSRVPESNRYWEFTIEAGTQTA
jgi:hypothetical protein